MIKRCYICVELSQEEKTFFNTQKNYMGVYCHFNGGLANAGKILYHKYNTREKASRLIKHGSMRSLHETIKDTNFYGKKRDRLAIIKDEDSIFFNKEDIPTKFGFIIEYVYVYSINEGWRYYADGIRSEKDITELLEDLSIIN